MGSKDAALLWTVTGVYAAGRLLHLVQDRIPIILLIAISILAPLAFAWIHGTMAYGIRGMLTFVGVCIVVGNALENLGVRTGIPFGHYYFTDVMGPKILDVPILLGLAYIGMGYLSWTLGILIVGEARSVLPIPVVSASIMVVWDLALDPVWSTVEHGWVWQRGGAYFGVPLMNFAGWYLTNFVIYLLFAEFLRGRSVPRHRLPERLRKIPVIFYGVAAAGNLLLGVPLSRLAWVADATGRQWKVSSIFVACAGVSVLVMGGFVLLAIALPRIRAVSIPSETAPGV